MSLPARFMCSVSKRKAKARILLVGSGRMGVIRASIIHANPRMELCGIVDASTPDHLLEQYRIPHYSTVTEACKDDSKIDAVVISSPTHTHKDIIPEAAWNGLDIFTEKPVAENTNQIQNLFDVAAQHKVALCCGFQRRFDASYRAVMEADVGHAVTARLFFGDHPVPPPWFMENAADSDIWTDLASHDVDYITHVWRKHRVMSVYAVLGAHDSATMVLQFEGGAVATLFFSRSAVYGYDQRCEIFGTSGLVSVNNIQEHATVLSDTTGVHRSRLQHSFPQRFQQAFQLELDTFCDTILHQSDWPVSAGQCILVQRIVDAARLSTETGTVVKLPTQYCS